MNHNVKKTYVILLIWSMATAVSAQEEVRPIFDARITLKPSQPTESEVTWLREKINPLAHKQWQDCVVDFSIIDVTTGAFTRPHTQQKAYLYQYCETGHNFANDGIAILEDKKLITNILFEGEWNQVVNALPDVNQNDLSEILISSSYTNQGYSTTAITLLELADSGVNKLGWIQVHEDNCGVSEQGGKATTYKIYVNPAATPIFYREGFTQKCADSKWTKVTDRKPISLKKDKTSYFVTHLAK